MLKLLFSDGPLMLYPLVALVLFALVFITRVVAMMRLPSSDLTHLEGLPFASEEMQRGRDE